jgi:hypothetical protein
VIQQLCVAAVAFMLIAPPVVGQEFTETFEGGIPASWTIQDNFPITGSPDFSAVPWTVNTAEGMLNYTGGTGLAATASSQNHPGQYDVSLITPPFAITADPFGDTIRYTINLQRVDAFEAFDTNLSINGGSWITMVHDTSSLGPAYGTGPPKIDRGIDLGFFGAMPGDTVRVEFRYFSTFLLPMVRNEYVEIDNVRFPAMPVPEPTTLVSLLIVVALTSCRRGRR